MKKQLLALLGIALAFGSCSQDMENPDNNGQEIKLTSFIQPQAQTRGANLEEQSTLINSGQSVGVTITGASAVHQNVEWTSDGSGNLTNTGAPIYYKGTSAASITAYHPFNAEWTDLTANYTFNVATDQSGEGYADSDLLYATQTANSTALTTNLVFSHKLAKIGVSLTVTDGSDLSTAEISITNTSTEATVNLGNNGVVTSTGNSVSTIKAGEGSTAAAIIVPQTLTAGTKLISVSFNGLTYSYSLPAEKNFEAGKSYLFRLRINNKELTLDGSEVNDWDKEETEGDMEKDGSIPYITFHSESSVEWGFAYKWQSSTPIKLCYPNMEYSLNGSDWQSASAETRVEFGGELGDLRLRAISPLGSRLETSDDISESKNCVSFYFSGDTPVECTGDIRTLIDYTCYSTVDTQHATFSNLFQSCSLLSSAPDLPATALENYCYYAMFYGCTLLTKAPALPATTLAESCYANMFANSGIEEGPSLPATTLAKGCYGGMFQASSIVKAPALPATTLADYCYAGMFCDCEYLTESPDLLAPVLTFRCYDHMFINCANLTKVKMMATDVSAERCLNDWLGGSTYYAPAGTLTKSASLNKTKEELGVPSGWTIVNEQAWKKVIQCLYW